MSLAWCDATGRIGFGDRAPRGTIVFIKGDEGKLREFLAVKARHTYDGGTLLVPGIPEAPDQNHGIDALRQFCDWIKPHAAQRGLAVF